MSNLSIITDESYRQWVSDLSTRYQRSQIKAATSVNSEMLRFYWSLGRDIVAMDAENTYGSGFYKALSADLRAALPNAKGFSVSNLKYMRRFYEQYNCQQVAGDFTLEIAGEIRQQVADDLVTVKNSAVFQMVRWESTMKKPKDDVQTLCGDESMTTPTASVSASFFPGSSEPGFFVLGKGLAAGRETGGG